MKPKKSLKRPVFIASIVGVGCSSIFFFLPKIYFPWNDLPDRSALIVTTPGVEQSNNEKTAESADRPAFKEPVRAGLPVRMNIPKINVDTVLETVGLTPAGEVGVPKNPANAAWFELGPRPGDVGSSVITGHYGKWKNGDSSVFDELYKLEIGDNITVVDEAGTVISFTVHKIRRYDPNADALEIFSSDDGKAHLNIITCDGIWDKDAKQFTERLVVFSEMQK
jgi:LPXTG-site transpeptidase (sortase) family protein